MLAITLNPGIVPILAALLVLAMPRAARAPIMGIAAFAGLWLMFDREFGAGAAMQQMGLRVVSLQLDALNQIFGIALLIALAVTAAYASGRRSRYEDSAIMMLAGGAIAALFVGDFILFVAAAALSGLGAAWVVLASPRHNAARAGVRLLVWHGLEGLLFLVGVALHLSAGGGGTEIVRLDPRTLGGGFIFAALMIRVGAPLAHVWLKDVLSHASPAGAAALSAFSTMLGVYALARFFPAEQLLTPIGAAMVVLGAFYAAAEDDLRSAAAYGQTAQTGVCLCLIGIGTPLALASMEGHAFAVIFGFLTLQMALGAALERFGEVRSHALAGLGQAMPLTTALMLVGGLAAAGAPGFATYATFTAALESAAQWETRWTWTLFAILPAILFIALALRPALAAHQRPAKRPAFVEAPYGMLLGLALAAFFCVAVGLAPQWLYGLTPTQMSFAPFTLDRVSRQFELMGAAGLAFLALRGAGALPAAAPPRLLDMDALYRGPVAGAGRWAGVVALRIFGAIQAGGDALWRHAGQAAEHAMRRLDRPYAISPLAAGAMLAAGGLVIAVSLLSVEG